MTYKTSEADFYIRSMLASLFSRSPLLLLPILGRPREFKPGSGKDLGVEEL